jgi:hypothetical protein
MMNLKNNIKSFILLVTFLLSFTQLMAQTQTVSGTVVEPDGTTGMIGVNVLQKGRREGQ